MAITQQSRNMVVTSGNTHGNIVCLENSIVASNEDYEERF